VGVKYLDGKNASVDFMGELDDEAVHISDVEMAKSASTSSVCQIAA